jgi:hypothetical protein
VINICVPVLRRYDCLANMLKSLTYSSLKPDGVYIIDNGLDPKKTSEAINVVAHKFPLITTHRPDVPMGVAESWNWFIDHVPQERVITNDDVLFGVHSLTKLTSPTADLIWSKGCGFSCFVMRDSCVRKLGKFDETISPGYGYYEDDDYLQRLDGRGTRAPSAQAAEVDTGIVHLRSQTLAWATQQEVSEHHRRFKLAQSNYARKWNIPMEAFA